MEREMAGVPNHAQWNKSDRERQIQYDITYEWNLKSTISEYNKKEVDVDIENKLVATSEEKGKGQYRGGKQEVQTIGCKIGSMVYFTTWGNMANIL